MINQYNYQKEANISCLFEDVEYSERKNVFLKIIGIFEKENIEWGIGCSMNLFLRGIVDEFHDLDLIVDAKCIEKIKNIMEEVLDGKLKGTGGNGYCESNFYFHYQIGRVDVDVISGFRVKTYDCQFLYEYNPKDIEYYNIYEEKTITVPMIPAEALYILYCMMEGWQARRRFKRILIQEYLRENIAFYNILEDSLELMLPNWIKRNIRELLEGRK